MDGQYRKIVDKINELRRRRLLYKLPFLQIIPRGFVAPKEPAKLY